MAQRNPLSRDAVERTEKLHDTWRRATADRVITDEEQDAITPLMVEVETIVLIVDTAQAAGLTLIRCGLESRTAGERLSELVSITPDPLTAA